MLVYGVLATLRIVGSVVCLGMVHPDEFFQSQEVMARHVVPESIRLRRDLLVLPWEFHLPTPNRSVLFPYDVCDGFLTGLVSSSWLANRSVW